MGATCHTGHHSFTAYAKVTLALPFLPIDQLVNEGFSSLCGKRALVTCLVVATK